MELFKKYPFLVYVAFALAVVVAGAYFFGFISQGTAEVIISILGFGGLAGVRSWLDAKGWKTYFAAAMGFIGVVLRFLFPEMFTPTELAQWLAFWGIVGAGSLAHGIAKSARE